MSLVVVKKGYDSEEVHVLVRKGLKAYSIIPPRYDIFQYRGNMADTGNRRNVVISAFYNQCNKDETFMSVIRD